MYRRDDPRSSGASNLREDLLKEVVYSQELRPAIPLQLIDEFEQRRQRLATGYTPLDGADLLEWVKERSLVPAGEWAVLIDRLDFETPAGDDGLSTIEHNAASLVVAEEDRNRFHARLETPGADLDGFDTLLANWLQYYGPLSSGQIQDKLGVSEPEIEQALARLEDSGVVVAGPLILHDLGRRWCDADNYEYLLRLMRSRSRPTVTPEPVEGLTPFLHAWQTRFSTQDPVDQVFEVVERLRGLPMPAALWETEVLPARIRDYHTRSLDLLFAEGEVQWLGIGEEIIALCFRDDLELLREISPARSELLQDTHARYEFSALRDRTGLSASRLTAALWQEVWQGRISNDTMVTLRQGIEHRFETSALTPTSGRRQLRGSFNRARASTPASGTWYALDESAEPPDALARQELDKDRARLMLNRTGVVFRELCQRESAAFNWTRIFRALRLMELSGEVVSGYFFEGISGAQYMTPAAVGFFQQHFGADAREQPAFHINATDPISPSGLGLGAHGERLPRRLKSNHLVMHGARLVLSSQRNGRSLFFHVPPDCPDMAGYLGLIHHLCYRSFQPQRQFVIDEINDEPASKSPYLAVLEASFNVVRDYKSVRVQREL
jgi:ATP-dependent Lhr-like helicase